MGRLYCFVRCVVAVMVVIVVVVGIDVVVVALVVDVAALGRAFSVPRVLRVSSRDGESPWRDSGGRGLGSRRKPRSTGWLSRSQVGLRSSVDEGKMAFLL